MSIAACTPFSVTPRPIHQNSVKAQYHPPTKQRSTKLSVFLDKLLNRNTIPENSKATQDNIWRRIQADFQIFHYTEKAVIQAQIRWFMSNPSYLNRTIRRAAPYMHYIYEEVKKRNLPAELVLLPIVESAYNPLAINRSSGASGLWQLMPGTARGFGVRQDWLFDGRRDIHTSTHAALDYLTYLQHFFSGDWLLALAAYDTGEGNVQRAIRRNAKQNLSTSFWLLPLSLETRSYVPRLLALSAIVKHPKKYGMELPNIGEKAYLEQIDVNAGVSILQVATLADMSLKDLKRFNPGFKQITATPTVPYKLLLPTGRIEQFKQSLAKLPAALKITSSPYNFAAVKSPKPSTGSLPRQSNAAIFHSSYYKTKPGDKLNSIAKHYGVSLQALCRWNGLTSEAILPINKTLIINQPISRLTVLTTQTTQAVIPGKVKQAIQYYTVRKGDNLSEIASQLNVQITELKTWNNLTHNVLYPGQRLKVLNQ